MRPIPLVCVQYSISEMSIVTRWGTVLLINNLLTFAFLPESRSLVQCQYVSSVHAVSTIRDTSLKKFREIYKAFNKGRFHRGF